MDFDLYNNLYDFITNHVQSIENLEAILLLHNNQHKNEWSINDIASRLYVNYELACKIMENLKRLSIVHLIKQDVYEFVAGHTLTQALNDLEAFYKKDLIGLTTMIQNLSK